MLEAWAATSPSRMPLAVPFHVARPAFSLHGAMAKLVGCAAETTTQVAFALHSTISPVQSP